MLTSLPFLVAPALQVLLQFKKKKLKPTVWLAPERLTYTLCTTWMCFGQWTLIIQGLRHTNLNTNDCRKHRRLTALQKWRQKVSIAPWCLPAVHAINPDGTGVTRPAGVWAGLWRPHSSPADSGCKSATQQLPQMGNFGFIFVPWEEVQPGRPSVMLKTSRWLQGDVFCPN